MRTITAVEARPLSSPRMVIAVCASTSVDVGIVMSAVAGRERRTKSIHEMCFHSGQVILVHHSRKFLEPSPESVAGISPCVSTNRSVLRMYHNCLVHLIRYSLGRSSSPARSRHV